MMCFGWYASGHFLQLPIVSFYYANKFCISVSEICEELFLAASKSRSQTVVEDLQQFAEMSFSASILKNDSYVTMKVIWL